jgi:outer membrane lipoprotein carrier protein
MAHINFKRIYSIVFLFVFLIFISNDINAFEFTTVSDVVKNIRNKFSGINAYQADFTIVSEKLGSKTNKNGVLKYKADNKMLVEFSNPPGQKIISNGKKLWIYLPSMNVVAEQDLKSGDESIFASSTSGGLSRLFSKYHYKFASKTQPEKQDDGTMRYTLSLKQRETRSGFRTIKLWVSEEYMITKALGESTTGKSVEIKFNKIQTNVDLPGSIFQFDFPKKARIIKNPMISEE